MKVFFSKMMSKVSSLFSDAGLGWSSTRFSMLFTIVLSNLALWGVWVALSIHAHAMIPIDSSIITVYSMANALHLGAKLIQKGQESKPDDQQ